jgi:hypothetical protein
VPPHPAFRGAPHRKPRAPGAGRTDTGWG